ncbi:MAG: heavy-metal-associated domain-containing protein [Oscillospiraceae bacterium]|jgi:copper chaperone CopZ|nr:heavy-metal-associated domain-containing protein [Oscillospiraceae bacterium]
MKKKYAIEVDCANCAQKVEDAINKVEGVTSATVSFVQQKLIIEAEDDRFDEIMANVVKAAKKAESDFEIEL